MDHLQESNKDLRKRTADTEQIKYDSHNEDETKKLVKTNSKTISLVFMSLLLDLLAFTMILPLLPSLLDYYNKEEGSKNSLYSSLLDAVERFQKLTGAPDKFASVLFGGALGSMYSFLQFLTSPIVGSLSDAYGRKKMLLICLFHSDSYNCEEDSGEQLLKLKSLFKKKEKLQYHTDQTSPESSELSNVAERESVQSSATQERLNVHSRAYTAGWVIRKILNKHSCQVCEDNLTSRESNIHKNSLNNWISFKEFKTKKQRKLTYPSEYAVRLFGIIVEEANKYLETKAHQGNIIKNVKAVIQSKYSFDFLNCELHKDVVTDSFLTLTLKLTVFNWCNVINKILKGIDVIRLGNKSLPQMQLKAYNKFKTKMKNKMKIK